MRYQLTPAVERVLAAAAHWTLRADGEAELDAPQLLWHLTEESECRAATILHTLGITPAQVRAQGAALRMVTGVVPTALPTLFTPAVDDGLAQVLGLLADHPRPLLLATEHLLLALALGRHDTARWLLEHGLNTTALEAEIHRRAGQRFVAEPLAIPDDAPRPSENAPLANVTTDAPALWRVLDAAANRAGEGLRVIEDYVRFVLDDAFLTRQWKELRHALGTALGRFAWPERLAARDTLGDVGTSIATESEMVRDDLRAVVMANLSRLQESLRSLEEFAKLLAPAIAGEIERVRYRCYTLHRATEVTLRRSADLATARLYVLLDGQANLDAFERLATNLIAAGVDLLQLRDKQLDDRTLLARARRLRVLTRASNTRFIMNDRPDLALLAEADGVHVGQEELSVSDVRKLVGSRLLVGVSAHSLAQAHQAVLDGADYIGVGPTFPSQTKMFAQFTGLELLGAVARDTQLPAFAIGGITLDRLDDVLATGINRVAVSAAIVQATDPRAAADAFRRRLEATSLK